MVTVKVWFLADLQPLEQYRQSTASVESKHGESFGKIKPIYMYS